MHVFLTLQSIYRTSLLGVTISTRLQQTYYQQQQHMSHFLTNHFTNQHHHPLLTMLTCIVKRLRARFSCLAETKLDIYTFGIFPIWLSDNDSNFVFLKFYSQPFLKKWSRLLLWSVLQGFWDLKKTALHKIRNSGTCAYVSQKLWYLR